MVWPFRLPTPSGFTSSTTAEQVTNGIDASNLTSIVTGANSGVGMETTRVLAMRGAQVVMAVRNVSSGENVKKTILEETNGARLHVLELDLSSMSSVRKFSKDFKSLNLPLNILVNNAGVMACPYKLTTDGIEMQFGTNHIGHFLLTTLLLDELKKTAKRSGIEGRIVNVSSDAHNVTYHGGIRFDKLNDESSYKPYRAYGQSKLANVLHAKELAKRLQDEGESVIINSLHPGIIKTNLYRNNSIIDWVRGFTAFLWKTVPQGAATQCYVALHPSVKGVSGKYFRDCNEADPSKLAGDPKLGQTLWEFSENLTAVK